MLCLPSGGKSTSTPISQPLEPVQAASSLNYPAMRKGDAWHSQISHGSRRGSGVEKASSTLVDDEISSKAAKQEAALEKHRIDKGKFERADREARKLIDAERQARDA